MIYLSKIQPPESDHHKWFEEFCLALYREIWKDPNAKLVGSRGDKQDGVDIVSSHTPGPAGVECKCRDSDKHEKFKKALTELVSKAEGFSPPLSELTFAVTLKKNASLEKYVRELRDDRVKEGKFPVYLMCWDDLLSQLKHYPLVYKVYYPKFYEADIRAQAALTGAGSLPLIKNIDVLHMYAEDARENESLRIGWNEAVQKLLDRVILESSDCCDIPGSRPIALATDETENRFLALLREDGKVTCRRLRICETVYGDKEEYFIENELYDRLLIGLSEQDYTIFTFDRSLEIKNAELFFGQSGALMNYVWAQINPFSVSRTSVSAKKIKLDQAPSEIATFLGGRKSALVRATQVLEDALDSSEVYFSPAPVFDSDAPFLHILAWIKRNGEIHVCFVGKADGEIENVSDTYLTTLKGRPLRIKRYWRYSRNGCFLFISNQDVIVYSLHASIDPAAFFKILGRKRHTITDATLLHPFAYEFTVVIGYEDGVIEKHHHSRHIWKTELIQYFPGPVTRIRAENFDNANFAASDRSGLIVVEVEHAIKHVPLGRRGVQDFALIDDATRLVTLDENSRLELWPIGTSELYKAFDFRFVNENFDLTTIHCGHVSCSITETAVYVTEPALFASSLKSYALAIHEKNRFKLGRIQGSQIQLEVHSKRVAWASRAPKMFLISGTQENEWEKTEYRLISCELGENKATVDTTDLGIGEVAAIACTPDGDKVAVLDGTGKIVNIHYENDEKKIWTVDGFKPMRISDEKKQRLLFSPDGRLLIHFDPYTYVLRVFRYDGRGWRYIPTFFDSAGGPQGDAVYDHETGTLFVGLIEGGIVELVLNGDSEKADQGLTYPGGARRYSHRFDHELYDQVSYKVILLCDSGRWLIAASEQTVYIWEVKVPDEPRKIHFNEEIVHVNSSREHDRILVCTESRQCVLISASQDDFREIVCEKCCSPPVFSTDGSYLLFSKRNGDKDLQLLLYEANCRDYYDKFEKLRERVL